MIICFTGTGNTRNVANRLQEILGDDIVRFAPGQMSNPERINIQASDGRVIWAFPVHGWGVPPLVVKIMKKAYIEADSNLKHYMVATCGDDVGYADRQWRSLIKKRGMSDIGAYSVQMPNTYTFLPGFDVDPQELAEQKLAASKERVDAIAEAIQREEKTTDVVHGTFPWVKTKVFYPFFHKFLCSTKHFHVTDACGGCGKCARNCSTSNISLEEGKPKWGKNCTNCLRCYHGCPRHAVAYGTFSKGKGQYLCPGYILGT